MKIKTMFQFAAFACFAVLVLSSFQLLGQEAAAAAATAAPDAGTAAAAAAPAAIPDPNQELTIDWIGEIVKGGITAFIQIVLSLVGVAVVAERLFHMRKKYMIPENYLKFFTTAVRNHDLEALASEPEKNPSVLAEVGAYYAENSRKEKDTLWNGMLDVAGRSLERQRGKAAPLTIVASMEPMLGLLGTMIGMIEAFAKVALLGDTGDASVLADSIGKALITTAVGLIIALPALGFYFFIKQKLSMIELRMEEIIEQMIDIHENPGEADDKSDEKTDEAAGESASAA